MTPTGNTILVTGGGSGIGRALAQRWDDRGNHVVVTGRREDMLEETVRDRPRMSAYALDVSDAQAVRAFGRRIADEHPALNVLVNNAGVFSAEDPSGARDLTGAEGMVVTNLLGPIRMVDALIDHLKGRPGAAIVNVSSGLAFVPYPAAPTYSATSGAPLLYGGPASSREGEGGGDRDRPASGPDRALARSIAGRELDAAGRLRR